MFHGTCAAAHESWPNRHKLGANRVGPGEDRSIGSPEGNRRLADRVASPYRDRWLDSPRCGLALLGRASWCRGSHSWARSSFHPDRNFTFQRSVASA